MRRRTLVAGGALAGAAAILGSRAEAADAMIARRFADSLSAHDLDAFAALFAEGYVNHQASAAAPPPAGISSKAATVAFFAARLKALPDLKVSIETTVAEADKVAASFVYEGTQQGPYYGDRADPQAAALHLLRHLPHRRREDRRALGHGRHRRRRRADAGVTSLSP